MVITLSYGSCPQILPGYEIANFDSELVCTSVLWLEKLCLLGFLLLYKGEKGLPTTIFNLFLSLVLWLLKSIYDISMHFISLWNPSLHSGGVNFETYKMKWLVGCADAVLCSRVLKQEQVWLKEKWLQWEQFVRTGGGGLWIVTIAHFNHDMVYPGVIRGKGTPQIRGFSMWRI